MRLQLITSDDPSFPTGATVVVRESHCLGTCLDTSEAARLLRYTRVVATCDHPAEATAVVVLNGDLGSKHWSGETLH